jgi:hypothetical protein
VELHEGSEYHKKATGWLSATQMKAGETVAEKTFDSLKKDVSEKITHMFRTCHAIAKHNRPLADFEWQCELDDVKGITLGQTYRNSHSTSEFIKIHC